MFDWQLLSVNSSSSLPVHVACFAVAFVDSHRHLCLANFLLNFPARPDQFCTPLDFHISDYHLNSKMRTCTPSIIEWTNTMWSRSDGHRYYWSPNVRVGRTGLFDTLNSAITSDQPAHWLFSPAWPIWLSWFFRFIPARARLESHTT